MQNNKILIYNKEGCHSSISRGIVVVHIENLFMSKKSKNHRYSRLAPAASKVAGQLHSATSRMGHVLEQAISKELLESGVARSWGSPMIGGHLFAYGATVRAALSKNCVHIDDKYPCADLWFMSCDPKYSESFIIQIKTGGRLGKAQRAGEAEGLIRLTQAMSKVGLYVIPVICAFDAPDDKKAEEAVGKHEGVKSWSGPSLCFHLGIDYDRVMENWLAAAGAPSDNDEYLVDSFYASLVAEYGERRAKRIWDSAVGKKPEEDDDFF